MTRSGLTMANVIGISAHFHDAACCVLRDGVLVAAAEGERFSRLKHDPDMPVSAFNYCLKEANLSIADIDCVAYYEDPGKKLARQIWMMLPGFPREADVLARFDPQRPEREIRERLGYEGPIEYVGHHLAHAASAYLFSGFEDAAIFTVDGVGEWDTTTYGAGRGDEIRIFESVEFPDSLGLLYSAMTSYLGFEVNEGEYKVMGLAPYGRPTLVDRLRRVLTSEPGGQYRLDLRYFDFQSSERMFTDELTTLLQHPPRVPGTPLTSGHEDLARSLQVLLEDVLLEKVAYLHDRTKSDQLCMAGGVALNCVANGRIAREGPFARVFVQPAASDAGGCLGAAAIAAQRLGRGRPAPLEHVFLGPSYMSDDVVDVIDAAGLKASDFRQREGELWNATSERLANGQVVGWFQGRMEFGPRALGARSILADPRNPGMRDRINARVKRRESFRPFAPVVLESRCPAHFDLRRASPYMLETCQVTSPIPMPAVTHVDGSARVQTVNGTNPRLAGLLEAFERRTGCPVLLNTSFNMNDEPIVCTPIDALVCFIRADLDALVIEDFLIDREALGQAVQLLFRSIRLSATPSITHRTYTLL